LFMMFFMPILLVVVITSVQNSAFELVNNNKISLIVFNKDKGLLGGRMVEGLQKTGLFNMKPHDSLNPDNNITSRMYRKDALVAVVIPADFTVYIQKKADEIATRALKDPDSIKTNIQTVTPLPDSLLLYYNPVMQASFRQSEEGALGSSVQGI